MLLAALERLLESVATPRRTELEQLRWVSEHFEEEIQRISQEKGVTATRTESGSWVLENPACITGVKKLQFHPPSSDRNSFGCVIEDARDEAGSRVSCWTFITNTGISREGLLFYLEHLFCAGTASLLFGFRWIRTLQHVEYMMETRAGARFGVCASNTTPNVLQCFASNREGNTLLFEMIPHNSQTSQFRSVSILSNREIDKAMFINACQEYFTRQG